MINSTDIRPGEAVLANRIRMSVPATIRDRMLPPADEDVVREVRRMHGECNNDTAKRYVVKIAMAVTDDWDNRFIRMRLRALFTQEVM